ncbi:PpiC-type peptidyl-prolyl cis-trans isomerase [uncultured Paludibacter sp.]|nr:PpiC-type peptidyl-prolyl cis-trans isomerase [uncultured Paludibacter sp.]
MKKIIAGFVALAFSTVLIAQKNDPTLMTINGKNVPLSEFEYIYNKNNSGNVLDKKSLDEYVDLFINFRLKVEEALAQKLDTLPAFKSELGSYQNQLIEPYLQDNEMKEKLLKEAYDRTKNEVEVSHILIKIPNIGTAADTLTAYNKAMDVWKRASKEDFEKLALEVSEDPSVQRNKGYVGWITAVRTPYAFENGAFNTPVGTVSKPVRTFLGYHLIKVMRKRPSQGEALVAHIMKFTRPDSIKEKAKATIDSIYQRVLAGDNFAELAKKYSDDKGSARNGGELMWFGGEQRMVPEFEDAAFALKNKGDISKPVLSMYGWHIIKLLDKKPLADFDAMKSTLEGKVMNDERAQKIKNSFVEKMKKEYGFQLDKTAVANFEALANKYAPTDSIFKAEAKKLNKNLFSIGSANYTQADFADFINASPENNTVQANYIKDKLNTFINNKVTDYEKSKLDSKYPEYHYLTKEYHDGILLFDVSNREVWDKAAKDTEGLEKFFKENKANYAWDKPHYKGRIIYCKDKATLNAAKSIVKNAIPDSIDKYLPKRLNDSIQYVKIEKGLWIEGENKVIDASVFKKAKFEPSKEYPYCFVAGKMLKKGPETYEDVRGAVTTDYQNYLEKEWIASLRKKYPVVIDENVLKTVKKN